MNNGTRRLASPRRRVVAIPALITALSLILVACGDGADEEASVEDFYADNTLTVLIGFGEGGGYDLYGRLIADHWGDHIPGNPDVVVENQEGARGVVAMNRAYQGGPFDGSLVVMPHRVAYQFQLTGDDGVEYDLNEVSPIGSPLTDAEVCVVHERTGVTSFDQMFTEEVVVGATAPGEETLLNEVLGTQMQIVSGYGSGDDINLAIEQGEVDGRCQWSISSILSYDQDYVAQLNMLAQLAIEPHPQVPDDIPLIMEYAEDDETVELFELVFGAGLLGRPVYAPPDVPEERVQALRDSFMAMLEDPDFLADAESRNLEILPISGSELQDLQERFFSASDAAIERMTEALSQE